LKMGTKSENRNWGSRPPRAWLDAPRVQMFVADLLLMSSGFFLRSMFSARARKTAPEAGALPFYFSFGAKYKS